MLTFRLRRSSAINLSQTQAGGRRKRPGVGRQAAGVGLWAAGGVKDPAA